MGMILMRNVRVGRLTAGWETHVYPSPLAARLWPQPFTATPPSVPDSDYHSHLNDEGNHSGDKVTCPGSSISQRPQQD